MKGRGVSRKKSKHIYLSKAPNWKGPCQVCLGQCANREQRQGFEAVAMKIKDDNDGKHSLIYTFKWYLRVRWERMQRETRLVLCVLRYKYRSITPYLYLLLSSMSLNWKLQHLSDWDIVSPSYSFILFFTSFSMFLFPSYSLFHFYLFHTVTCPHTQTQHFGKMSSCRGESD